MCQKHRYTSCYQVRMFLNLIVCIGSLKKIISTVKLYF